MKSRFLCVFSIGLTAACLCACSENSSSDAPSEFCGDGIRNNDEVCDGLDATPASCSEFDSSKKWLGGRPGCSNDCTHVTAGTCVLDTTPENLCGNGVRNNGELCDKTDGTPATCEEFDSDKRWLPGGKPGCASDCKQYTSGSCVEDTSPLPSCGDGIKNNGELCDKSDGTPATCEEFDSSIQWAPGGKPECNASCTGVTRGTCKKLIPHEVTFTNWNVQVDYESWGGKPIDNRVPALYDEISSWTERPDIFAIIEVSPNWHRPDVTAVFESLGYTWADSTIHDTWADWGDAFTCGENKENAFLENTTQDQAASCFLFTDLLYKKTKFDLVEADYIPLFPPTDWDGLPEGCSLHIYNGVCSTYNPEHLYVANKAIAFAVVLREKTTGQEFIAVSTHWNPNNGVDSSQIPKGIIGPVANNERVRVYGAGQMSELIQKFKAKYPGAHIIAGGDFNTTDLRILYENEAIAATLAAFIRLYTTEKIEINDRVSLIHALNALMDPVDRFSDDFIGSHAAFAEVSGLIDARSHALSTLENIQDLSTSSDSQITQWTDLINLNVIIDFTFFSDSLKLLDYNVVQTENVATVSDHAPVRTKYQYMLPESD